MNCSNCHKTIRDADVQFLLYLKEYHMEGWITICTRCSSFPQYKKLRKPHIFSSGTPERKLLIPKEN